MSVDKALIILGIAIVILAGIILFCHLDSQYGILPKDTSYKTLWEEPTQAAQTRPTNPIKAIGDFGEINNNPIETALNGIFGTG